MSELKTRLWRWTEEAPNWPEMELPAIQQRPPVAICFSGGGTRSMSATWGQLRALHSLGLVQRARYLSCVSGATWVCGPYLFYRAGPADDADFLGPIVAPETLTMAGLQQMSDTAGGHTATRSMELRLAKLIARGVHPRRVWLDAVAQHFYADFGLHVAGEMNSWSWDEQTIADIRARNPALADVSLWPIHPERPYPVINACLIGPTEYAPFAGESPLSMQFTPLYSGSPAARAPTYKSDDERSGSVRFGGGFVEPFAFGSEAPTTSVQGDEATVAMPEQPWGLSDASATASSAFAGEVEDAQLLRPLEGFTPHAPCWPIPASGEASSDRVAALGDGGVLENLGLLSMLQRQVRAAVVFVNGEVPLDAEIDPAQAPGPEQIDPSLGPLFGWSVPVKGTATQNNQVFAQEQWSTLVSGLLAAKATGGPVAATTDLEVVDNAWWGIRGGWTVRIHWVVLDRAPAWEELLVAPLRKEIDRGHTARLFHGPFRDFPNYKTMGENFLELLQLTPEQVNLLAEMTCWSVLAQKREIEALFDFAER